MKEVFYRRVLGILFILALILGAGYFAVARAQQLRGTAERSAATSSGICCKGVN